MLTTKGVYVCVYGNVTLHAPQAPRITKNIWGPRGCVPLVYFYIYTVLHIRYTTRDGMRGRGGRKTTRSELRIRCRAIF